MPLTISGAIANAIDRATQNPKTTIQALLSAGMFWCLYFTICQCVSIRHAEMAGAFLTASKIALGLSQNDKTSNVNVSVDKVNDVKINESLTTEKD